MTFKVHLIIACDVFRCFIAFKSVLLQVMSLENPEFHHQMSKFHILMTVVCTFFKNLLLTCLFLNVSFDRLANNDLLSLDPFGPTLTGGSSYSAPASTGTFYTSSCLAFWIDLFLLNSCTQWSQLRVDKPAEQLRFSPDKNDCLGLNMNIHLRIIVHMMLH